MSDDDRKSNLDPDVRERTTELLYAHLPALYRVLDMAEGAREPQRTRAPRGAEALYKFLHVLAAPVARVRQNIEELHADLFIDKSADWVLPYLAQMIGMRLVLPDAAANRRDVRGTVGWRRRKGTPAMLAEMASELSGQMVVTAEGWQRVLLSQHLDLDRRQRTIVGLRPATIAERTTGPLDAAFHAIDPRRIGRATGRIHPLHVAHWCYPTRLFPLREGAAFDRTRYDGGGAPQFDRRFAFHPLGVDAPLRVRRSASDDRLASDRVPPLGFAERPQDFFSLDDGRFTVRITGLVAAVAAATSEPRQASATPAAAAMVAGLCNVLLLKHTADRLSSEVEVDVLAVPLDNAGAPVLTAGIARGGVTIKPEGGAARPGNATAVSNAAVMIRLKAAGGYFPGATVEVAAVAAEARRASGDSILATMGFLAGALIVELPAMWVVGERWLFLAADGSVFAGDSGTQPEDGRLPGRALTVGPGPAWPPLPLTAEPTRWRQIVAAATRGPVVMHCGLALDFSSGTPAVASSAASMALVFALRVRASVRPFLRLAWSGPDPASAGSWVALGADGAPVASEAGLRAAWHALATATDDAGDDAELWVRLESDAAGLVLPPCEVAYTGDRGDTILIHLPELLTVSPAPATWSPALASASFAVSVGEDGSTFWAGSSQVARFACGQVAPIRQAATLRRRQLRRRTLCWWKHETGPLAALATPAGRLDLDPSHGLFAFAAAEPPQQFSACSVRSTWSAVAPVTVDFQDGYTEHVGARPAAREPVLRAEQPRPTRLVIGGGRLHRGAPADFYKLPHHASLGEALAAVAATASEREVIQIEDSATYVEDALVWPDKLRSLTIQAAEFHRPVLALAAAWTWPSTTTAKYRDITLRGLVIRQTAPSDPGPPTTHALAFPPATAVALQFCTAADPRDRWKLTAAADGDTTIELVRCVAARLEVVGAAKVEISDSVVDGAGGAVVSAVDSEVRFERVTVAAARASLGTDVAIDARVIEASDSLFTDVARAHDRFAGCVRYSRVEPNSLLPRRHRVTEEGARFVTRDRTDPAHLRLSEACPPAIARGAEDGSEMGAFHGTHAAQRGDAVLLRLGEYTPAGLSTGLLRMD